MFAIYVKNRLARNAVNWNPAPSEVAQVRFEFIDLMNSQLHWSTSDRHFIMKFKLKFDFFNHGTKYIDWNTNNNCGISIMNMFRVDFLPLQ